VTNDVAVRKLKRLIKMWKSNSYAGN